MTTDRLHMIDVSYRGNSNASRINPVTTSLDAFGLQSNPFSHIMFFYLVKIEIQFQRKKVLNNINKKYIKMHRTASDICFLAVPSIHPPAYTYKVIRVLAMEKNNDK